MAHIIPFKGLRYNNEMIKDLSLVTTPPYDVISPSAQENYYNMHPNNVIRLELGKEYAGDGQDNNKYTRAASYLNEWIASGILTFEASPALYLYEQVFTLKNGVIKSCKGIVALVELEEFSKGVILPHEETLSKAKTDRFNLMSTTYSNFSQIFSLYMDAEKKVTGLINRLSEEPPHISFKSADNIIQNLWIITNESVIAEIQEYFKDKQLFIADGHHRYETALNFRNKLREENPQYSKDDLFNYVMMMLVEMDDPGLVVFPTHRVVKDLEKFDEQVLIDQLKENFDVERIAQDHGTKELNILIEEELNARSNDKVFGLYTGKDYYYILTLKNIDVMAEILPNKSAAYRNLDVSILHTLILDRILGIDAENMANQKNLTYTRDSLEAVEWVRSGGFQCSFLLNATKVHEIKDVSLAKEKMPQKSTYFYPKVITGLVMNKFK
ncbi:MAG: hypothetical protein JG777_1039 [Clostridia bacterium]|jgi:uncharacterized protein (DUF1015 family)|nr:hypothetical protein [Clostridia bacterium]